MNTLIAKLPTHEFHNIVNRDETNSCLVSNRHLKGDFVL